MAPNSLAAQFEALSDHELAALYRAAKARASLMPWLDAEELVDEAFVRTADGINPLKPGVKLVAHLIKVMQNITHHALSGQAPTKLSLVTEKPSGPNLVTESTHRPATPDQASLLFVREVLPRLEQDLESSEVAALVLAAALDGMKGPEAKKELDITEREYRAAIRYIRRTKTAQAIQTANGGLCRSKKTPSSK